MTDGARTHSPLSHVRAGDPAASGQRDQRVVERARRGLGPGVEEGPHPVQHLGAFLLGDDQRVGVGADGGGQGLGRPAVPVCEASLTSTGPKPAYDGTSSGSPGGVETLVLLSSSSSATHGTESSTWL